MSKPVRRVYKTNKMLKLHPHRWSRKYDECSICHRTSVPHEAKGQCKNCYIVPFTREYRKKHPQKNYRVLKTHENATRPKSGQCEICTKKCNTVYDHDHKTGKFRGWICQQCNTSLGMIKDKIEILQKMITYLVKNS